MIDRRAFIKSATAVAFGGLMAGCETRTEALSAPARLERIGVGLFTMPHLLEQNFAEAMKKLAGIGYKEVELFGPYPFSVPEAHDAWRPVAETLGLSQSGYFGLTPAQVREILDENGLASPSMHIDMKTLQTRLDKDMTELVRFAGDGGDPSQWIELFPYMADAGSGVLDLAAILTQARKAGVQHFYLERDLTATLDTTLEKSYHFLSSLTFEA